MPTESKKLLFFIGCVCATAAIAGLLFGYDTGVISAALIYIRQEFTTTIFQEELIVAMVPFGAIFGALIGGPLSDSVGRRPVVLASALLFAVSAIMLASSQTVNMLILSRFFVGIAIGVSSSTAPIYISEIAPRSFRGALVTLNQLAITIGILLAYIIGFIYAQKHGWRTMFFLASIPAILQFFLLLFFPESPRFLAMKGKFDLAFHILRHFRADQHDAHLELDHIRNNLSEEAMLKQKHRFHKDHFKALTAGIGLTVIQQITGINAVIYYSTSIFRYAGFSSAHVQILATVLIGVVNVITTVFALALIDRIGRRPLLLTGIIGMAVSLFVLGIGFFFLEHLDSAKHLLGWISIICLVFYIAFFAYSLGPGAWLINSEIYPLEIRGKAMGLSTCLNWASNFLVSVSFLSLLNTLGTSFTFWLFAIIGIGGFFFMRSWIPETKGKSLEEIESFWRHS